MRTRLIRSLWIVTAALAVGCGGGGGDGGGGGIDLPPGCDWMMLIIPTEVVEEDTLVPPGCWIVEQDIYVDDGVTLEISPGAELYFVQNTGIEVNDDGALVAVGTAAYPILLSGWEAIRGYWNGVTFTNSDNFYNELTYVTVEYAGAKQINDDGARPLRAAVFLDSSGYPVRATITHSIIQESSGYGLYLDGYAIVDDFTGNVITGNVTGAAYTYHASAFNLTDTSTYTGNDDDMVFVNAAYDYGDYDWTWQALGVPYVVDGGLLLYSSLTIEAGATLEFTTTDSGIEVSGDYAALIALGTAAAPIVFTGVDKIPGSWGALLFVNTNDPVGYPRSVLDYVVIEYGGGWYLNDGNGEEVRGNLMLDSSGTWVRVKLTNSLISDGTGYGVWHACQSEFIESDNTYDNNDWGDIEGESPCTM